MLMDYRSQDDSTTCSVPSLKAPAHTVALVAKPLLFPFLVQRSLSKVCWLTSHMIVQFCSAGFRAMFVALQDEGTPRLSPFSSVVLHANSVFMSFYEDIYSGQRLPTKMRSLSACNT